MPTLHWTTYYHFTNPLCLPLSNTPNDIERNKDMLYRLTTPLTHRQFTYIGYKKLLKTFTEPRANEFTLEFYDYNIIRTNQDQFLDEDRFANSQLTENFFVKTSYVFTLNIFDRKYDHIISEALTDMQAYESFKEKFQLFSLTVHFLAPHERDCTAHTKLCYALNKPTPIHIIASSKIILIYTLHQDNHTIVFSFLIQSTLRHFF